MYSFSNTTSVGNVTSVLWEFGDGNTSTFAGPSYTYNAPGTYEVCLTTYDGENACGVICQDVNVFPLGVSDVKSRSFSIYPNPSVSELNITMNQADSKTNVTVYNILGKQILSQQLTGFTSKINISQWNVGVYLVKVTNDSGTQTKRFVKQ